MQIAPLLTVIVGIGLVLTDTDELAKVCETQPAVLAPTIV
jgi:Na+/citrate or Na+/malate symporter